MSEDEQDWAVESWRAGYAMGVRVGEQTVVARVRRLMSEYAQAGRAEAGSSKEQEQAEQRQVRSKEE